MEKTIYKKKFKEDGRRSLVEQIKNSVDFARNQKKVLDKRGFVFLADIKTYHATYNPVIDEVVDSYDFIDSSKIKSTGFKLKVYTSTNEMASIMLNSVGEKFSNKTDYIIENGFLIIKSYNTYGDFEKITPSDRDWKQAVKNNDIMIETLTVAEIAEIQPA